MSRQLRLVVVLVAGLLLVGGLAPTLGWGATARAPGPASPESPAAAAEVQTAPTTAPADPGTRQPVAASRRAPQPDVDVSQRTVAVASSAPLRVDRDEGDGADRAGDWLRQRREAALGAISYPWQQLGFDITFLPARGGLRAYTYPYERRIEVYVRPGDPVALTAFDLAHEIGHAVDVVYGTHDRRAAWYELRGIAPDTPWWPCTGCDEYRTGAGDFAEVFAVWQVGAVDYRGGLAAAPAPADMQRLAPLFQPSG